MDPSSTLQTSDSVVSLSRYFSAASLGFALWEHAITLDLECQLVWRLSRQSTKWVFLLNRYGLIFGLAYSFCVTLAIPRRHLNDKFCQSNIIANLICIMLSTFCSNIYLVIRLHQLWDRRRSIFYVLISAMAVTHTASFCLSVAAMKRFFGHISYDPHIGACNLAIKESALMAAWALIVAFDVIMVATLTTNALDRPRHRNIELLGYLKSDSAAFFAGLLVLRVIALVFLATLPPSKAFIYSFYLTWPLTSAAMSRFVLGSEAFTYRTAGQADYLTYEMETRKWRPRVIEKIPGSAQ